MKTHIKQLLIPIGAILTIYSIINSFIEAGFYLSKAIDNYFEYFAGILTLNITSIITVLGPTLIVAGIFVQDEYDQELIESAKRKYKIFILLGIIILIVIFSYIFTIGVSLGIFILFSLVYSPIILLGIILIIVSIIKLKKLEKK